MDTYLHARFTCLLTHSLTRSLTCSLSSLTGLLGLAQLPGKISSIICSLTSRSYSALSLAYYEKVVLSIQVVFCVVKSYSARPSDSPAAQGLTGLLQVYSRSIPSLARRARTVLRFKGVRRRTHVTPTPTPQNQPSTEVRSGITYFLLTYSRACSSGLEIVFCSLTGEP